MRNDHGVRQAGAGETPFPGPSRGRIAASWRDGQKFFLRCHLARGQCAWAETVAHLRGAASTARFGAALLGIISSSALAAAPMPPRDVVVAKFAAVNRHSVEDVVAFYAPDAKVTASDFCTARQGSADVKRTYEGIFAAVPDATVEVQEYIQQDDRVAVRFTLSSRLPGRSFDVPLQDFFTVRDGLIVRDDGMFDNHGRPCTP